VLAQEIKRGARPTDQPGGGEGVGAFAGGAGECVAC
jgi:hypothetical protein